MKKLIKLELIMLVAGFHLQAASEGSEFAAGRASYIAGEFKKAASHFQLALRVDPNNAGSNYWLGMSYQVLADIASPFNGNYTAKARTYLTRAVQLDPGRKLYRRELFEFLLDSAASSRTALRQAAALLQMVSESDLDYIDMRRRLEHETRLNSSPEVSLARLFLAAPQAAVRIAGLPASALSIGSGGGAPAPPEW
jgi:tetratricopeptide (TPR) repeat protein